LFWAGAYNATTSMDRALRLSQRVLGHAIRGVLELRVTLLGGR